MDLTDIVEALSENSPHLPQILFLDEFDKLCVLDGDKSNVGTYGGQRSLLKILEAARTRADGYSKSKRDIEDFDMSKVIIILGGAFSAFKEKQEVMNKSSIGFSVGDKETKKETTVSERDLIAAGIIPEIAGRLGQVIRLNDLSKDSLKTILTTSKESVLKTFKMLAYYDNKEFNLTNEEIDAIIKESQELGLGVRGLSTLTEKKYIKQMIQGEK
jgi:ATP-dependent Clp protease ATP-binding subunit ClpX